jgi:hypothetical protein
MGIFQKLKNLSYNLMFRKNVRTVEKHFRELAMAAHKKKAFTPKIADFTN